MSGTGDLFDIPSVQVMAPACGAGESVLLGGAPRGAEFHVLERHRLAACNLTLRHQHPEPQGSTHNAVGHVVGQDLMTTKLTDPGASYAQCIGEPNLASENPNGLVDGQVAHDGRLTAINREDKPCAGIAGDDPPMPKTRHKFFEVLERLYDEGKNAPGGKWTQALLAARSGISPPAIGYLFSGRTKIPNLETVVGLARAFDVSFDYLITGRESGQVSLVQPWERLSDIHNLSDYFLVPDLGVERTPEDVRNYMEGKLVAEEAHTIAIRADILREAGLDPKQTLFVMSADDAVEQAPRGARIMIAPCDDIEDGRIYALDLAGKVRFRRLFVAFNDTVIVKADRPGYPEMTVKADELKILGRAYSTYRTI